MPTLYVLRPEIMKPRFHRILWSDYITMISGLFPIVGWVLYLDSESLGIIRKLVHPRIDDQASDPMMMMMALAIVLSATFLPILIFRITRIYTHFSRSTEVIGTIDSIMRYKDRGRIEFRYILNGREFRGVSAINRTKLTRSLSVGQEIVLMVDAFNPDKALIRDLYI